MYRCLYIESAWNFMICICYPTNRLHFALKKIRMGMWCIWMPAQDIFNQRLGCSISCTYNVLDAASYIYIMSVCASIIPTPSAAPQAKPDWKTIAQCSGSPWIWLGLQAGVQGDSNLHWAWWGQSAYRWAGGMALHPSPHLCYLDLFWYVLIFLEQRIPKDCIWKNVVHLNISIPFVESNGRLLRWWRMASWDYSSSWTKCSHTGSTCSRSTQTIQLPLWWDSQRLLVSTVPCQEYDFILELRDQDPSVSKSISCWDICQYM